MNGCTRGVLKWVWMWIGKPEGWSVLPVRLQSESVDAENVPGMLDCGWKTKCKAQ